MRIWQPPPTRFFQLPSLQFFPFISELALVIGWKLMSPISPLCLCHHLISKSHQEFHLKM